MDFLQCAGRQLSLAEPQVMGILNVTPDSFSDGGLHYRGDSRDLGRAIDAAAAMVAAGASIIDVGGESTRPGASPVSVEQELQRVVPVVEALTQRLDVIVSVDTSSAPVISAAARAGAGMINDVRALRREGALAAAAATALPVCLMHMQAEPDTMQRAPGYGDVVAEVEDFLVERMAACQAAGIARNRLLLDPGFGFGKTLDHNLALFRALPRLARQQLPLMVGVSRKSMIGQLLDCEVEQRLNGSVVLALLAAQALHAQAGCLLRVHDVKETVDALALWKTTRSLEEHKINQ